MALEIKRLESAIAVAEEGALNRAAVRLNLSQSALSRRIHELERDLNFALFEHVGRGIRLTAEGKEFLEKCRELVALARAVEDQARTYASGDRGVLRVGASSQTLEYFFPEVLRRYTARFPLVKIELLEENQKNLLVLLEQGDLDFAVSALPQNDLINSRILAPTIALAGFAQNHLFAGVDRIDVKDLGDLPVLLVSAGFKTRQVFDATCELANVKPRIVFESGAPQTLLALAEAGLGIAIFPSNRSVNPLSLRIVPLVHEGELLEMPLAINWMRSRFLPRYAEGYIDIMTEVAHEKLKGGIVLAPNTAPLEQLSDLSSSSTR